METAREPQQKQSNCSSSKVKQESSKAEQHTSSLKVKHAVCTKDGLALAVMLFAHPLFGKIICEIFNIIS